MRRRDAGIRIVGAGLIIAGACGGPPAADDDPRATAVATGSGVPPVATGNAESPAAPAGAVVLPDLSRLPETVRAQVEARHAALVRLTRGGSGPPAATAPALAEAHGELGLILLAADFETAALSSLRAAHDTAPADPRWPYYLAQLHLRRGEHDPATVWFERALERRSRDVATLVHLGRLYLDRGRLDEAEPLFRRALADHPDLAAAHAGLGHAALAGGRDADAARHFQRALALDAAATSLHYPLGIAYRNLGEPERAETHLGRRGDVRPAVPDPLMDVLAGLIDSALAYQNRGFAAMREERWEDAAAAFRRGVALEPDNPALRHPLATALYQTGRVDEAVAEFEETIRRTPDFAPAHYSLGVIAELEGRPTAAVPHFEAAIRHNPDYVEARLGLARSFRPLRRFEEMLVQYARVVELDPRQVEAWLGRADVLIALGRYAEAHAWLDAARKVHPDQPELALLQDTVETFLAARR